MWLRRFLGKLCFSSYVCRSIRLCASRYSLCPLHHLSVWLSCRLDFFCVWNLNEFLWDFETWGFGKGLLAYVWVLMDQTYYVAVAYRSVSDSSSTEKLLRNIVVFIFKKIRFAFLTKCLFWFYCEIFQTLFKMKMVEISRFKIMMTYRDFVDICSRPDHYFNRFFVTGVKWWTLVFDILTVTPNKWLFGHYGIHCH